MCSDIGPCSSRGSGVPPRRICNSGLSILRFNADGTYADNSGDAGTWSVNGDLVTLGSRDGSTLEGKYFLDGNDLTFILSKDQFLHLAKQEEDLWTTEDQEIFDVLFAVEYDPILFLS